MEEPLEIRVAGSPFAVLLRTPGQERELLAGFLASEGVLRDRDDLGAIDPCRNPETQRAEANIWNVGLAPGVAFEPAKRRWLPVGSTCGLCGARTLEELARELPKRLDLAAIEPDLEYFAQLDHEIRRAQATYQRTAGCHGAGLFDADARMHAFAEDVGRHNAVDKVLGSELLADRYPAEEPRLLFVTGRISFEIVQKAAMAGVSTVAGAGAPTSLAVEAARRAGVQLLGLVRPERANRYC